MEQKRLYRSRKDRMLAGVCGGVAEYFHVDPTPVRLLFVLAGLMNGVGVIVYLALWLLTPENPEETYPTSLTMTPTTPVVPPVPPAVVPPAEETIEKGPEA
jgi:phage shock protein C